MLNVSNCAYIFVVGDTLLTVVKSPHKLCYCKALNLVLYTLCSKLLCISWLNFGNWVHFLSNLIQSVRMLYSAIF